MWEPNPNPFQCEVKDPEKKSKYRGIKSFIAYTVIPDVRTCVCVCVCACVRACACVCVRACALQEQDVHNTIVR